MGVAMKSKFTNLVILHARQYWADFTPLELAAWWRHYTIGTGRGMYSNVGPSTGFFDFLVLSARQSAHEKACDL